MLIRYMRAYICVEAACRQHILRAAGSPACILLAKVELDRGALLRSWRWRSPQGPHAWAAPGVAAGRAWRHGLLCRARRISPASRCIDFDALYDPLDVVTKRSAKLHMIQEKASTHAKLHGAFITPMNM